MGTSLNERMRSEWNHRAEEDAERFIYTRDSPEDVSEFAGSGKANYLQLIKPYLPILLNGRQPRDCAVVEIGCGIGRMTEWMAKDFGRTTGVDVSEEMVRQARARLAHIDGLSFLAGTGSSLDGIQDSSVDLVFSYIVFQHIPDKQIIDEYIRESARVLKRGGAFKFQVNGDRSPDYLNRPKDTWHGVTLSRAEVSEMLDSSGFSIVGMEGVGTQYFVITAFKGEQGRATSWVMPGDPSTADRFIEGFGAPVDQSWRPMAGRARVDVPGSGKRIYLGLYFWPDSCRHQLSVQGNIFEVSAPGDHYFEWDGQPGVIELALSPEPVTPPAFRVMGVY